MADAMDSKSISRKGVGVQVPASAPEIADPLARALLPVLLHRIANAAQLLSGLDALLPLGPAVLEERSGDLASAGETVDDVGWLLALLASASGSRLLLERRNRGGLAPLLDGVRSCLRRDGRDLAPADAPLPDLSPDVADGWQLPWAIASLLFLEGRGLAPKAALPWSLRPAGDSWSVECDASPATDAGPSLARLLEDLPGARFHRAGGKASLAIPRAWLRPAGTR